jgi:hypothetical protein
MRPVETALGKRRGLSIMAGGSGKPAFRRELPDGIIRINNRIGHSALWNLDFVESMFNFYG